jgi:hypothetical protein
VGVYRNRNGDYPAPTSNTRPELVWGFRLSAHVAIAHETASELVFYTRARDLRQYLTVLGHEQSGVDPPPTDAEKQPFAELRSQLGSIGQSIRRRMLDQAEDHLGEWTEKFKNLRLERQRRLLQIIEARQAAAAAVDPQKWDSLRSEIRRSLRDGDPDKSVEPLRMLSDLVTLHLPEVPAELQRVAGRQGPEPEQAEGVPPPIAPGRQRATTARTRAGYARYAVQAASVVFATVTGIMAILGSHSARGSIT